MNEDRALALARRQRQLLARSAELRGRVAAELAPWQPRLALVDRARTLLGTGWRWLRAHPEVPAGVIVAAVVLRPMRAWRWTWHITWVWGRRAWLGWQLFRRLRPAADAPGKQAGGGVVAALASVVAAAAGLTRR